MNAQTLDKLFNDLEQVQSEPSNLFDDAASTQSKTVTQEGEKPTPTLGLGLAVVARIIRNMNGQLRLKSEEGKGSRFVLQFPFDIPESEIKEPKEPTEGSFAPDTPSPSQVDGELTLVAPSLSRKNSGGSSQLERRASTESINSKTSKHSTGKASLLSGSSMKSNKSDVDRLIEAIQEPHLVDNRGKTVERSRSSSALRPVLTKRNSLDGPMSPSKSRERSTAMERMDPAAVPPPHQRSVDDTSVKAVKMPDDMGSPAEKRPKTGILGEIDSETPQIASAPDDLSTGHMRVLVAEDDPMNSRIIKKRLEKLGHSVYLTINGEECASAFGDKPQDFDVILMDMQVS
jgi:CheY-like chemotaxis protein